MPVAILTLTTHWYIISMSFSSLPYEVHSEILQYAVHGAPGNCVALPCVSPLWRDIALPILHSHIYLKTHRQLLLFSDVVDQPDTNNSDSSGTDASPLGLLQCCPQGRRVEIHLPTGSFAFGHWQMIFKALKRCEHHDRYRHFGYTHQWFNSRAGSEPSDPIVSPRNCCRGIRSLKFCFDAYNDPGVVLLGPVLSQIRPEEFICVSPNDQEHAVAISSVASLQLCKAIRTWDSLRVLNLSNIVFPDDGKEFMDAIINLNRPPQIQAQTLRAITSQTMASEESDSEYPDNNNSTTTTNDSLEISLRRAAGLHPLAIVLIILSQPRLTRLHLEDVYRRYISSTKIALDEVEIAFLALWDETDMHVLPEINKTQWVSRIRRIVEA